MDSALASGASGTGSTPVRGMGLWAYLFRSVKIATFAKQHLLRKPPNPSWVRETNEKMSYMQKEF